MITVQLTSLNHEKVLRTLRIPGEVDPAVPDPAMTERLNAQIRQCIREVLRCCRPRLVYRILPVKELSFLLVGNDIHRLLASCTEAVLMALTLGAELERRLMQEEVTNMGNAYLLDVCASQAVEEAADHFEDQLRKSLLPEGRYLTNRFSPGYGDLPLSMQRPLLESVDAARAIGLTMTATNLMVPRKSITAVLGISDRPKADVHGGCAACPLLTKCSFREHGERCYGN